MKLLGGLLGLYLAGYGLYYLYIVGESVYRFWGHRGHTWDIEVLLTLAALASLYAARLCFRRSRESGGFWTVRTALGALLFLGLLNWRSYYDCQCTPPEIEQYRMRAMLFALGNALAFAVSFLPICKQNTSKQTAKDL